MDTSRKRHRVFLECADPRNSCDHLNEMAPRHLTSDSLCAWPIEAACIESTVAADVTPVLSSGHKNTVHWQTGAISRTTIIKSWMVSGGSRLSDWHIELVWKRCNLIGLNQLVGGSNGPEYGHLRFDFQVKYKSG